MLQLPTQLTGQACNCKQKCSMAKCWLAACQLASLVLLTGMGGPAGLRHTANHCIAQCQRQPEAKLYVHRLHCQLKQLRNAVLANPTVHAHHTCVLHVRLATVPLATASQGTPLPLPCVVTMYVESCSPPPQGTEQLLQGIQEATQSTANVTEPARIHTTESNFASKPSPAAQPAYAHQCQHQQDQSCC